MTVFTASVARDSAPRLLSILREVILRPGFRLEDFERIIISELLIDPETHQTREQLFTAINIAIQLSIDEVEESFEMFDTDTGMAVQLPEVFPALQILCVWLHPHRNDQQPR